MDRNEFSKHSIIMSAHIKADSETALYDACTMIFNKPSNQIVAYKVVKITEEEESGIILVLYRQRVDDAIILPEPIFTGPVAFNFLRRWYFQQNTNDFITEMPFGDGTHGTGYEIYTGWENVSDFVMDSWPVLMVFKPIRIYYSK